MHKYNKLLCVCVCVYIYIYIYIYMCVCVCVCVCKKFKYQFSSKTVYLLFHFCQPDDPPLDRNTVTNSE